MKRCCLVFGLACTLAGWADPPIPPPALPAPAPLPHSQMSRPLPAPPSRGTQERKKQSIDYETAPLLALANNPKVAASLANVRSYIAESEKLASPARPQGRLQLLGPPIPTSGNDSTFRSDFVLAPITLEVRKLVYDGGRIAAVIAQGKSLARQSALEAQAEWQQLYFAVRQSYLSVLAAQNQEKLAAERVQRAQEQLRQAELRFRVGKAPRGDVLSATLPVSQAELVVQKNQSSTLKAMQELNQLLGLPIDTALVLGDPKLPEVALPDLDHCLQESFQRRPDLKALEHQMAAALKGIEAAQLDNHPYMNFLLGVSGISQDRSVIGAIAYRGGFEFNWSFADGGKSKHMTASAKAAAERDTALWVEQKRVVEMEVRDAYRNLQLAVETHVTEQKRVEQARDALRIAQAQYNAGMINVYPVRQAQTDLYDTQSAEGQAYFDYFLALASLDLACGRSGDTPLETPFPKD